jgi:hypothetical protein
VKPTPQSLARTVWDASTLESRFAKRVSARLSQSAGEVPHDVSERLRVARERAMEHARRATQSPTRIASSAGVSVSGQAVLHGGPGWGWRLASLVPVVAMVAGLLLVQSQQDADQTLAAADIDAALLSDDLPPDAYSDAGFVEYLRNPVR